MATEFPGAERDLRFFPIHNDAPKHLTQAQIQHFNERGYVLPAGRLQRSRNRRPSRLL